MMVVSSFDFGPKKCQNMRFILCEHLCFGQFQMLFAMVQILKWNHYRLELPVPLDVFVQIPLTDIPSFHFQKTRVKTSNCLSEDCLMVHCSISSSIRLAFNTEKEGDIL